LKEIEFAEKIWQEHEKYIRKFCSYKLSSHPDLIDDCLQDVFLALLNKLGDSGEIQYPKAWLTKVASNKIKDIYEAEKIKNERQVPYNEEYVGKSYSFEDSLCEEDLEKHLDAILEKLDEKEKKLLEDFYSENISQKEIAEKLGITENNVRQQIFRLKRKVTGIIRNLLD